MNTYKLHQSQNYVPKCAIYFSSCVIDAQFYELEKMERRSELGNVMSVVMLRRFRCYSLQATDFF